MTRATLLVLTLVASVGCSSRASEPPSRPIPASAPPPAYPVAQSPVGGWAVLMGGFVKDLPCPLPGLPPEVTSRIDCSAMRRTASAVAYAPRQVVAAALPPTVDLRAQGLSGPIKDQDQVGACSGFAMSSVLDNTLRRTGRGDVIAPLHVFATYTGGSLDDLVGKPFTVEPVLPYHPPTACRFSRSASQSSSCGSYYGVTPGSAYGDPALLSARARADASGAVRIDALEYLEAPFDFDQFSALLADGEAVWLSMRWNVPLLSDPTSTASGYLPWYPPESTDSLHAVTLEGYRWGGYGREFLIKNSWGQKFGDHGFVWVPESMMRTHLEFAYRVRSSLGGTPSFPAATSPATASALCLPGLPCLPAPTTPSAGLPALNLPSALPTFGLPLPH